MGETIMAVNRQASTPGGPQGAHILVTEDEMSVAKGLQMVLADEGYSVDVAMTGKAAIDLCGRASFDVLVADLRLPDIDGMEVIKQVKEWQPQSEAIVITGYPSVSSAVEAVRSGVHDYLRKPFTDDEIRQAVQSALQKQARPTIEEAIAATERENLIQREEVVRVLDRTSTDLDFWRQLMEAGSEALEDYRLSAEAKAAILSGDLEWIREHVGDLSQDQLMFLYKRLEREAW
jgi:DNA-binding response OmpR family regulator